MGRLRIAIGDNVLRRKKTRRKNLTLAIALGATAGLLAGITINSQSDKICEILKKIKTKSSEYVQGGKNKVDDLVQDGKNKVDDLLNKNDGMNI